MSSLRTSIWLVPSDDAELALSQDMIVLRNSRDKQAAFRPHVTLATGPHTAQADSLLQRLSQTFNEFYLQRDGVLIEEGSFIRSYAMKYSHNAEAGVLCRAIKQSFSPDFSFGQYPLHLSLVYGPQQRTDDLEKVAASYDSPMVFNRLIAVTVAAKVTSSQADVAAWQEGQIHRLASLSRC